MTGIGEGSGAEGLAPLQAQSPRASSDAVLGPAEAQSGRHVLAKEGQGHRRQSSHTSQHSEGETEISAPEAGAQLEEDLASILPGRTPRSSSAWVLKHYSQPLQATGLSSVQGKLPRQKQKPLVPGHGDSTQLTISSSIGGLASPGNAYVSSLAMKLLQNFPVRQPS